MLIFKAGVTDTLSATYFWWRKSPSKSVRSQTASWWRCSTAV